ncbi:MAG: hypothetical protein IPG60_01715 [Bacteroidetes bacterium]|nr:hypothetical protein [Bacteroidota bacterium]MBK8486359.1 hypothetical protein [Bacteroidota bacterium]MBK8683139.1 hypothetical protein [Bacteroidota bacterium]MBP9547756.1 hypothetical protein [Chitinophagales bacterium]MBP9703937.1 hypothetical protein [Chitinophagales bacterium]
MQINGAHWHLLLNHFPIILSIIGTGFLFASLFIKNNGFRKASLFIIVVAGLFAIPAYNTGEAAEDVVENSTVVSETYLEQHEEFALGALAAIIGAAVVALIALGIMQWKSEWTGLMILLAFLASIIAAGFLGYTGYTGGKIMHAEIRNEAGSQTENVKSGNTEKMKMDNDDD